MSKAYTITQATTPDLTDVERVRQGLFEYNQRHTGDDSYEPITLLVRDHTGTVVGGLLGSIYWGWLAVDILWLADEIRHQGWGSRLLHTAEQIAIAHGCHGAHLDTMSFQAPSFYEKHGYTVFGVLDDMPRGQRRYFLKKDLSSILQDPNHL